MESRHIKCNIFKDSIIAIIMLAFVISIIYSMSVTVYAQSTQTERAGTIIKATQPQGRHNTIPCSAVNLQKEINCTGQLICKVGQKDSGWQTCCGCPGDSVSTAYTYCRFGICNETPKRREELRSAFSSQLKKTAPFKYVDSAGGKQKTYEPQFTKCEVAKRGDTNAKDKSEGLHAGCETHMFKCNHCGHWFYHHLHLKPLPNPIANLRVEPNSVQGNSPYLVWEPNGNPPTTKYIVKFVINGKEFKNETNQTKMQLPVHPNVSGTHTAEIIPIHPEGTKGEAQKITIEATKQSTVSSPDLKVMIDPDTCMPGDSFKVAVEAPADCTNVIALVSTELINGKQGTVRNSQVPKGAAMEVPGGLIEYTLKKQADGIWRRHITISDNAPERDEEIMVMAHTPSMDPRNPPHVTKILHVDSSISMEANIINLEWLRGILYTKNIKKDILEIATEDLRAFSFEELDNAVKGHARVTLASVLANERMLLLTKVTTSDDRQLNGQCQYVLDFQSGSSYKQLNGLKLQNGNDTYFAKIVTNDAGKDKINHTVHFKVSFSNGKFITRSVPYLSTFNINENTSENTQDTINVVLSPNICAPGDSVTVAVKAPADCTGVLAIISSNAITGGGNAAIHGTRQIPKGAAVEVPGGLVQYTLRKQADGIWRTHITISDNAPERDEEIMVMVHTPSMDPNNPPHVTKILHINSSISMEANIIRLEWLRSILYTKNINKDISEIVAEDLRTLSFEELDNAVKGGATLVSIPANERMILLTKVTASGDQQLNSQYEYALDLLDGSSYKQLNGLKLQNGNDTYFAKTVVNDVNKYKTNHTAYIKASFSNGKTITRGVPYLLASPVEKETPFTITIDTQYENTSDPTSTNFDGDIPEFKAGYGVDVSLPLTVNFETDDDNVICDKVEIAESDVKCYILSTEEIQNVDVSFENIDNVIEREECIKMILSEKIDEHSGAKKIGDFVLTDAYEKILELKGGNVAYGQRPQFEFSLKRCDEYKYGGNNDLIYTDPATPDGSYSIVYKIKTALKIHYIEGGQQKETEKNIETTKVVPNAIRVHGSMYDADFTQIIN